MNGHPKWRWAWRDFGYRFSAAGRNAFDYYEGLADGDYYPVPRRDRKFTGEMLDLYYDGGASEPTDGFHAIACPWASYGSHWDLVVDAAGWPLNVAGCLDRSEVERQEDLGVARAFEFLSNLRDDSPLTAELVREIHRELMGEIYPFAGEWRTVPLARGRGVWPLPPNGVGPHMDELDRTLFSRTPFVHADRAVLCTLIAEVMNEILAVHPFREGNGRAARLAGSLILLQNDLPAITEWDREHDARQYIAACEAGRTNRDNGPLAALLRRWVDAAVQRGDA